MFFPETSSDSIKWVNFKLQYFLGGRTAKKGESRRKLQFNSYLFGENFAKMQCSKVLMFRFLVRLLQYKYNF